MGVLGQRLGLMVLEVFSSLNNPCQALGQVWSMGGLGQVKIQWDACDTNPAAPLDALSPSGISRG